LVTGHVVSHSSLGTDEMREQQQRDVDLANELQWEALAATGFELLGLYGSYKTSQKFWGGVKVTKGKIITGLHKKGITVPSIRKYSPMNIYEKIKLKAGITEGIPEEQLYQSADELTSSGLNRAFGNTPQKRISWTKRHYYLSGQGDDITKKIGQQADEFTLEHVTSGRYDWSKIKSGTRGESPVLSGAPLGEGSPHWTRIGDLTTSFDDIDYSSSIFPRFLKRRPETLLLKGKARLADVDDVFRPRPGEMRPQSAAWQEAHAIDLGDGEKFFPKNLFYERSAKHILENIEKGKPFVVPKMGAGGIESEIGYVTGTQTTQAILPGGKGLVTVHNGVVVRISVRDVVKGTGTKVDDVISIGELAAGKRPSNIIDDFFSYSEISSRGRPVVHTSYISPSRIGSLLSISRPRSSPTSSKVSSKVSSKISSPISSPLSSPISSKTSSKVSSPISSPISFDISSPISSPIPSPISSDIPSPVSSTPFYPIPLSGEPDVIFSEPKKKKKRKKGSRRRKHPVTLFDIDVLPKGVMNII